MSPSRMGRYRRRRLGRSILLACIGVGASAGFVLGRASNRLALEQEPIPMAPVPVPEDEDVCCRGNDGLVRIMFLSECRQSRGKAVERRICAAALKPVCCKRLGLSDWSDSQGCDKRGGTVVDEMSCRTQYDLICCEFPRSRELPTAFVAWAGKDQCVRDKGTERPKARCEDPLETVCCQQPDKPTVVHESSRQNCQLKAFREVPPEQCAQVCCHSDRGTRLSSRASCPRTDSQIVVAARECEDVCCKTPNKRNSITSEGDCRDQGGYGTPVTDCGTTVEVEKPPGVPEEATEPPLLPTPTDRLVDRPPASTPYM
ncbi:MAG TPA: hypothetical protein VN914_01065 [Polyangia bacterium]|nr:hypothetical protein [Polyangia bacterium]